MKAAGAGKQKLEAGTLASKVFGPEHERVTLFMAWYGRGESPAGIASRLLPTMQVLTGRYPGDEAAFHALIGPDYDERFRLPVTLNELTAYTASRSDRDRAGDISEQGRTRLVSLLLPDPSNPVLVSDATLSVVAGTPRALDNKILIRFEDSFPLGTPGEAAQWFLDLVKVWQPEYAVLRTSLTNRTYSGDGTYAGYLSWASAKGFGALPDVPSAVRLRFGDGALYAAKEWTIEGVGAFIEDLRDAGATSIRDVPKLQDVPRFPASQPEDLDSLEELIRWGPAPGRS